jgi:hypothetical protein
VDLSDLDDGLDTAVAEEEASGVSKEGIMHQEGPLQIRTLKVQALLPLLGLSLLFAHTRAAQVWKERWFSLADDGHLVYWKNEKVRVQLSP